MNISLSPRTESRLLTLAGFIFVFFLTLNIFLLYKSALQLDDTTHVFYYPQLAWSFLHGRFDIPNALASDVDLSAFKGKIYLYWPPLTALLMMPIVALRGWVGFPHRLFGILFGALNAGLFLLLAERLQSLRKTPWPKALPALAAIVFGWGTSNLTLSIVANHWYIGQVTETPFMLLALYFGLDRAPSRRLSGARASGLCLAIAELGRQHVVLAVPLLVFLAVSDENFRLQKPLRITKRILLTALPSILVMLLMLAYNRVRFGNWFENGIAYHHMDEALRPAFLKHGCFSLLYAPRNFYFNVLRPPWMSRIDHCWYAMGFGLFYQSSFLLLAFRRKIFAAYPELTKALWITIALISLPIVTVLGTGYTQFGSRYLFDVVPLLSVLALLGLDREDFALALFLGILSIALNLLGPLSMIRNFPV